MNFLILAGVGLAGLLLMSWFTKLECDGREATAVFLIIALLVVEVMLYPDQNSIPPGFFHPAAGGALSFRIYELLIPMALLARVLAKGVVGRVGGAAVLWIAFYSWFVAAAITGYLNGNNPENVLYQAKAVIYVGGMAVLAAGVPIGHYFTGLRKLVTWSGVIALVMIVLTYTRVGIGLPIPGLSTSTAGLLGGDSGSVLSALGIVALVIGMCSHHHRIGWLLPAGPLLLCALLAGQRAALVGVVASLAVIIPAVMSRSGRFRVKVTPTEMGLVLFGLVGLMLIPTLIPAVTKDAAPRLPLSETFEDVFFSTGKRQSAQERLTQWQIARELISERPMLGWGLAKRYSYYRIGPKQYEELYIAHNIFSDLLVRMGVVGLMLFVVSMGVTIMEGLRTWRTVEDSFIAAMALGSVAAIAGWLSKAMAESLFEKYRLAVLLGLLLGTLHSAVNGIRQEGRAGATRPRSKEIAWN